MASGTVRFWAAARELAGGSEERYDAPTLAALVEELRRRHGPSLSRLLDRCSFVVDDVLVGGHDPARVELTEGGTVEVLPPFAGG